MTTPKPCAWAGADAAPRPAVGGDLPLAGRACTTRPVIVPWPSGCTTSAPPRCNASWPSSPRRRPRRPTPPHAFGRGRHPAPDRPRTGQPVALVGRSHEWALLTGCWREVAQRGAQLVVVSGEPGVGKTRLVEELASWCTRHGAVVADARSYPSEGELGYGVVISWLRTDAVADELQRASPSTSTCWPDSFPSCATTPARGSVVDPDQTPELDPASHRRRLFEADDRVLTASGRPTPARRGRRPVVRHAEPATHPLPGPIRAAPSPAGRGHRAPRGPRRPTARCRRWLPALEILDRASEISLDRLTRVGTEELAAGSGRPRARSATCDGLSAETEGNPLFIVETIRAGWDDRDAERCAP